MSVHELIDIVMFLQPHDEVFMPRYEYRAYPWSSLSAAVCDRPEVVPVAAGLGQRDSFLHQHDCIVNFAGHRLKFRSITNRVEIGIERQWPAV